MLALQRVGVEESFFDLGGDSLSAMRLVAAINKALDTRMAVRAVFQAPSVRALAQQLGRPDSAAEVIPAEILKDGSGIPLCCIHEGTGISYPYRGLGDYLECPIIGINQTPHTDQAQPASIRDMAKNYADRLQTVYPAQSYNLLGWSFGGVVAHQLAVELRRRGCAIHRLILLDPIAPTDSQPNPSPTKPTSKAASCNASYNSVASTPPTIRSRSPTSGHSN
ncbi:alpha/beta hydrolase family protein [Mycobacterium xenopi 3993]|nr:alpha/beta hydrolase family protein [Mycobacterium xenopi 3993]